MRTERRRQVSNRGGMGRSIIRAEWICRVCMITVACVIVSCSAFTQERETYPYSDSEVEGIVSRFRKGHDQGSAAAAFAVIDQFVAHPDSVSAFLVEFIVDEIGRQRTPGAEASLEKLLLLDSNQPGVLVVMTAAALAYGDLGGPRALEFLSALVLSGKNRILPALATALGDLDDPDAVEPLEVLGMSDVVRVKQRAIVALSRYCAPSSRTLVSHSISVASDIRIRRSAIWWLLQCGTDEDREYFVESLSGSDELLVEHAIRGLLRLKLRDACSKTASLVGSPSSTIRTKAKRYEEFCRAEAETEGR